MISASKKPNKAILQYLATAVASALILPSAAVASSGGIDAEDIKPPTPPSQEIGVVAPGSGGVIPISGSGVKPKKAKLVRGKAIAPAGAPLAVQRIITAANRIACNPYRYGGGHKDFRYRGRKYGYDCSGTVSFALNAAGASTLKSPLASGDFFDFGDPGPGKWVTIYTKRSHMYVVIAGLRFDTSLRGKNYKKSRWSKKLRSTRGYRVRNIKNL